MSEILNLSNEKRKLFLDFHIPDSLFKYTSLNEYMIEDLEKGRITSSSFINFNDVFDSKMHYSSLNSTEMKNIKLKEMQNTIEYMKSSVPGYILSEADKKSLEDEINIQTGQYEMTQRHSLSYLTSDLRIFCLSSKRDSNLMWSHYTNNHRGICIEYDFNTITLNTHGKENLTKKLFFPVVYCNKPIDVTDLMQSHKHLDAELGVICSAIVKSNDWAYEDEWRILLPLMNDENKHIRFPINGLNLKPKCIYLGSQFSYSLSDIIYANKDKSMEEKSQSKEKILNIVERLLNFVEKENITIRLSTPIIGAFNYDFPELNISKLKKWFSEYYKHSRIEYHLINVINEALIACKKNFNGGFIL